MGIYLEKEVVVRIGDAIAHIKADAIIVATGASENMVTFEGWTLPGVIGAGAAMKKPPDGGFIYLRSPLLSAIL